MRRVFNALMRVISSLICTLMIVIPSESCKGICEAGGIEEG
jgi:hypothetical protein